jgi:hypothetical protein
VTLAPQIVSQTEDAPARGILPNISLHLAGESHLFPRRAADRENQWSSLSAVSPRSEPQVREGDCEERRRCAANSHVNEQVTWITEGLAEVYSQGRK